MIYKYTIPLPPVTKKNSQRILVNRKTGMPFIAPSSAYKRYEQQAITFSCPKAENSTGGALSRCCGVLHANPPPRGLNEPTRSRP